MKLKLYEKLGIKFVKYIPFITVFAIFIGNIEAIYSLLRNLETTFYDESGNALFVLYSSPINDEFTYFFQYSWATIIPLLLISFRMNFCTYHQIPIYFMMMNLLFMQIYTRFIVPEFHVYMYSITLINAAMAILISIYFYKHKKPNKR